MIGRRFIEAQVDKFILRRGREELPLTLTWKRIYVLPSKPGMLFFSIWFVMLIAGLNFNNNMSLMLVFLLFGISQVALLQTFFNLRNLRLKSISTTPVFCGEVAKSEILLSSSNDKWQIVAENSLSSHQVSLTAEQNDTLCWHSQTSQRGWQELSKIKIYSRYPMGLFTVWIYCLPQAKFLVYPQPEQPCPALPLHGGLDGEQSLPQKGDEISGLKEYQAGDPVRDIAWKKTAQSGKVWVKTFGQTQGKQLLFDFDQVHFANTEQKLSRLTAWVIYAEQNKLDYRLKLPEFKSPMSHGQQQFHNCLKALALFAKQ